MDSHSSRVCVTTNFKQPTQTQYGSHLRVPIWSCSRWGLPCRWMLPSTRCALTAPFHPYLPHAGWRFIFCCTSRRLAPPRRYLAPYPMEPGLSSPCQNKRRLSGELSGGRLTALAANAIGHNIFIAFLAMSVHVDIQLF